MQSSPKTLNLKDVSSSSYHFSKYRLVKPSHWQRSPDLQVLWEPQGRKEFRACKETRAYKGHPELP
jgi:hypothetical protein